MIKCRISAAGIAALNKRIREEEQSARLYKAMSVWLEYKGYAGAAKLFAKYSKEEMEHAEWSYKYMLDMDELPCVQDLKTPQCKFESLMEIANLAYDHECLVTEQCNELAEVGRKTNDNMLVHFAQHYLEEQREELAKSKYWVDKFQLFGCEPSVCLLIDKEMGESA